MYTTVSSIAIRNRSILFFRRFNRSIRVTIEAKIRQIARKQKERCYPVLLIEKRGKILKNQRKSNLPSFYFLVYKGIYRSRNSSHSRQIERAPLFIPTFNTDRRSVEIKNAFEENILLLLHFLYFKKIQIQKQQKFLCQKIFQFARFE